MLDFKRTGYDVINQPIYDKVKITDYSVTLFQVPIGKEKTFAETNMFLTCHLPEKSYFKINGIIVVASHSASDFIQKGFIQLNVGSKVYYHCPIYITLGLGVKFTEPLTLEGLQNFCVIATSTQIDCEWIQCFL